MKRTTSNGLAVIAALTIWIGGNALIYSKHASAQTGGDPGPGLESQGNGLKCSGGFSSKVLLNCTHTDDPTCLNSGQMYTATIRYRTWSQCSGGMPWDNCNPGGTVTQGDYTGTQCDSCPQNGKLSDSKTYPAPYAC